MFLDGKCARRLKGLSDEETMPFSQYLTKSKHRKTVYLLFYFYFTVKIAKALDDVPTRGWGGAAALVRILLASLTGTITWSEL